MAGYFSFRKNITGYFVKTIYALGFAVLTAAGASLAVWAGRRLNEGTIPTRTGVYFIAAGAGVLLIGNLAWRMICEFWLLRFNIHAVLVSMALATKPGERSAPAPGSSTGKLARPQERTRRTTARHRDLASSACLDDATSLFRIHWLTCSRTLSDASRSLSAASEIGLPRKRTSN